MGTISRATMSAPALHMTYFPIAGRADTMRLIAAATGLELTESKALDAGAHIHEFASPSGLPVLQHGDFKMSQSLACEGYLASLAPGWSELSAQHRATDAMFCSIKEEILLNCAKAVFRTRKESEEQAKADINALFDKWGAVLEDRLPEAGFVNGQGFPTAADCAMVNVATGFMPFGAARKYAGGYSMEKFPKFCALVERASQTEGIAKYLAGSPYVNASFFDDLKP